MNHTCFPPASFLDFGATRKWCSECTTNASPMMAQEPISAPNETAGLADIVQLVSYSAVQSPVQPALLIVVQPRNGYVFFRIYRCEAVKRKHHALNCKKKNAAADLGRPFERMRTWVEKTCFVFIRATDQSCTFRAVRSVMSTTQKLRHQIIVPGFSARNFCRASYVTQSALSHTIRNRYSLHS